MMLFHNPAYLVGTQRSGTTWVANVLNRSREALLIYEPFEKGLGLFDNMPEEPVHVARVSSSLMSAYKKQYEVMMSLVAKRVPASRKKRWVAAHIVDILCRLNAAQDRIALKPSQVKQLRVINQWHGRKIREHLVEKNNRVYPLIKETRLHQKLNLIMASHDGARIVVLLRHPYPVVSSCIKWMHQGRLSELRRKMEYFMHVYWQEYDLAPYEREMVAGAFEGDLGVKLATHWFISNDRALLFCSQHPAIARVYVYEELCRGPFVLFKDMFRHYGLSWTPVVEDYVQHSTTRQTGDGIVDTVKQSANQSTVWMKNIQHGDVHRTIEKYGEHSAAYRMITSDYNAIKKANYEGVRT